MQTDNTNLNMEGCCATEALDGSVCALVHLSHFEDDGVLMPVQQQNGCTVLVLW